MSFEEAEVIRRRAEAFLRNAERLMDENEWDLAVFNLEQYCQLILKYKLLIRTGSYPRTHSLRALIRALGQQTRKILELVENEKHLHYIARLEEAYITSRYLPYTYEEREVVDLYKFVVEVFKHYVESCEDSALEQFRDYMGVAREVKDIVKRVDPNARVYVFGSVVRGRYTASSDIDILVVMERIEDRHRVMTEVYKRVKAPIELHITTSEKLSSWYKRFIEPGEMVEIL